MNDDEATHVDTVESLSYPSRLPGHLVDGPGSTSTGDVKLTRPDAEIAAVILRFDDEDTGRPDHKMIDVFVAARHPSIVEDHETSDIRGSSNCAVRTSPMCPNLPRANMVRKARNGDVQRRQDGDRDE